MANEIEKRNETFLIYQDENGIARVNVSFEDVKHYGSIIYVLQQTERLMGDIDNLMTEQ